MNTKKREDKNLTRTVHVCVSEGFQTWMWKGLTFLLPFLLGGYVSVHYWHESWHSCYNNNLLFIKAHFQH